MGDGVCVITGGGRGIGAATARRAAAAGWSVCLSWASDQRAAEQVAEETGGVAVRADVAVERDVVDLFRAADELGPVRAVVANAGIVAPASRVESLDPERFRHLLDVNVVGAAVTAREAVRRMSTRHGGGGGSIVIVGSAASRIGSPNQYVDYAATKGAVDVFSYGLAKEVAPEGVRVNVVRPGLIRTDIHGSGGEPDRVERLAHEVPMLRGGDADEVAAAIVWLLSDDASYVTAATLDVGGGR